MPLKLNVGVSRKLGLPDYSSMGATCNLEVELESSLLGDPEVFHERVRDAYVACHQAVNDELARLQGRTPATVDTPPASNGGGRRNVSGPHANGARTGGERDRSLKAATPGQLKAIYAINRARRADLEGLLRDDYGVGRPEELSRAQASQLIDSLKAAVV